MSQRGSIKLPIVIAAVLGLGFGASAYLNYAQHQAAEQDKRLLQGQITDLRYQVDQDHHATPSPSASPTASPSASPASTPSPSPAVAGTASITIAQYGIHLTVTDPIIDLTYDMAHSGAYPVAALTTASLVAKYPGCKPSNTNNALGQIVRKTSTASTGTLIKKLGSWNYFYLKPSGYCATDQAGQNALAAARAAVLNAALPTLSN
jgi:hypothetical protein